MVEQKKYKILIVDDDNFIRGMYAELFKKEGFAVVESLTGLDALGLVERESPDVIFTGIIMPQMTGFELMEALKKNVKTAGIPVAVSSHLGRFEDQKKAFELGAKDFIYRGEVTPAEAVMRIKNILGQKIVYRVTVEDGSDALELARFLGKESWICPQCKSRYLLSAEYNPKDARFSLRLYCQFCEGGGRPE